MGCPSRRSMVLLGGLVAAMVLALLAQQRERLTEEYYLWRLRSAPDAALPSIVSKLWAMGSADKAAPLVLERIKESRRSGYPDGPFTGIVEALRALGKEAFDPAMELLEDDRPEIRKWVIYTLGDLRGKEDVVVPVLLPLLSGDPSRDVRVAALCVVSSLDDGSEAAIEATRGALKIERDPKVRRVAESTLHGLIEKREAREKESPLRYSSHKGKAASSIPIPTEETGK